MGREAGSILARRAALAGDEENAGQHDAEFARCKDDVAYFIHNYLVIDDTQGDSVGSMPFHLWPDQVTALGVLATERLVIFLKARQLGISWLCLAYALWLALFHPGKLVLLFSQGELEAGEMLRRYKAMYDRLPGWMLRRLPARTIDNTTTQGWANGSRCKCLPATQKAGRSFTASLAILDEAAHQQWGGKLYAAMKPTIDAGGKLFVVSSANGADGFFDKLWKKAESGVSTFRAIFLPWWSRPGRDQAWYDAQVADSTDPDLIKQEYPNTSIEAFVSSGRTRFHASWVAAQMAHARGAVPVPDSEYRHLRGMDHFPGLVVFKLPNPARRYIVSADPAEGLERGDASDAVVLDRDTLEEVACFNGQWEPDAFARLLDRLATFYNAGILVERNNHGHAVLLRLADLCGDRVLDGLDGRPGWLTNAVTKVQVIDFLAASLRDGTITIRSAAAVGEMQEYLVLANGGTGAPPGSHDDRVMSRAIALGWLKLAQVRAATRPLTSAASPLKGWRG
jgi:hypothetical protein